MKRSDRDIGVRRLAAALPLCRIVVDSRPTKRRHRRRRASRWPHRPLARAGRIEIFEERTPLCGDGLLAPTPIDPGAVTVEQIGTQAETDFYEITLTEPGRLTVRTQTDDGSTFDTRTSLLGPDGQLLIQSEGELNSLMMGVDNALRALLDALPADTEGETIETAEDALDLVAREVAGNSSSFFGAPLVLAAADQVFGEWLPELCLSTEETIERVVESVLQLIDQWFETTPARGDQNTPTQERDDQPLKVADNEASSVQHAGPQDWLADGGLVTLCVVGLGRAAVSLLPGRQLSGRRRS